MQAQGFVEVVSAKNESAAGKRFRSPLYSFKINEDWFNCGFDNPNISKGDSIEFSFTEDKFGKNVDVKSIQKSTSAPVATSSGKARAVPVSGDRQVSIVYQSQHRDAIEAVNFMITNGLVKLPTKQADKYDTYMELVKTVTVTWANESLDPVLDLPESSPAVAQEDDE